MMKKADFFCLAPWLLLAATPAQAGWYEVRNYVGTIGSLPVHVSLQTYDVINHEDNGRWRVDGSYYYDAHRSPIPLQGKRQPDGQMVLCEAAEPASFADSPAVPATSAAHPVPCPISLKVASDGASGEWHAGATVLSITLRQVGALNDTDSGAVRLDGAIEIPMWHHSKTHLLLGIYTSSNDCPISMRHLRLVNMASGRVDKDIPFDCGTGTVATPIYANVWRAGNIRHVTVELEGGMHGMGEDKDIPIEP